MLKFSIFITMEPFYQSELKDIRNKLIIMGEMCIEVVQLAMQSLENNDTELAVKVRKMDDDIDELEMVIDNGCVRYLTLRSPVASDVRFLILAMRACHDFERIGDEATTIVKRVQHLNESMPSKDYQHIPKINTMVLEQLDAAMHSFVKNNTDMALTVPPKDAEIDRLNKENYQYFLAKASEPDLEINTYFDFIFISKALERIGDHATNFAEEVIYLIEGNDIRHSDAVKRAES